MISENRLRQALEEYQTEALARTPDEKDCGHVFSDRFEKAMAPVLGRRLWTYRTRMLRMAASFGLTVLLGSALVLTLSPTVRASVMSWIYGHENNVYSYTATGTAETAAPALQYSIHQIPEGYSLWVREEGLTIYAQEESGRLFKLLYTPNDAGSTLFLLPEDAEKQTVLVHDTAADLYLSRSPEVSPCIVWVDPGTDYLICIDGFFSREELVNFAENILVSEVSQETP